MKKKVRTTVLQDPVEITVGHKTYRCTHCTVEGMIRISELIPDSPVFTGDDIVHEVFHNAKNCKWLGEVMAVLVVSARGFFVPQRRRMFAKRYMAVKTPSEMYKDFLTLIGTEEITGFFSLTTFLTEVNITKPTRKVVKTTASGQ